MRQAALLVCLLSLGTQVWASPRLLVVISVDQMRADYLDRFHDKFKGGLKSLQEEGAVLTDAHHAHIPTYTAPGHAAIMTGKYPDQTGIVGNSWWDAVDGRMVKAADDKLHGKGPERLRTYTIGDALKAKRPEAIVVSLSMKARAAIMMGGKKADLAVWYDSKTGMFETSSYYGNSPRWLSVFNDDLHRKGGRLARKGKKHYKKLLATPKADRLLLDLVERTLLEVPLGDDGTPDILAISFSGTDYTGHRYGPYSRKMEKQLLALDKYLGELIGLLKSAIPAKDLAIVLTSDHGVMPIPEKKAGKSHKARRVMEDKFTAKIEKALQKEYPAPGQKWVIANSFPNLYLNRTLAHAKKVNWNDFLETAAAALESLPSIAKAYVPGNMDPSDPYTAIYRRSVHPGRSGDIIMRSKAYFLHTSYPKGTSHGDPYAYDTHVPIIFWGGDFRTGLYSRRATVQDIAPTLGAWLGLDYPPVEGSSVRKEIFKAF